MTRTIHLKLPKILPTRSWSGAKKRWAVTILKSRRERHPWERPEDAPTDLVATPDNAFIALAWEDNSADETGFRVYRRAFMGPYVVVAQLVANTTQFFDTNVESGVTYTYYVVAFNPGGESAGSNLAVGSLIGE